MKAVIVLAAISAWAMLSQPVAVVKVKGNLDGNERLLVGNTISASVDDNLLDINLSALKSKIKDISWIKEVTIRRIWPSRLEVYVAKEVPVARWGEGGYLTAQGKIIDMQITAASSLPIFSCHTATPLQAMERYQLISDVLAESNGSIKKLRESEFGNWSADVAFGSTPVFEVNLGNDHLVEQMQRFLFFYSHLDRDLVESVAYVDARYSTGIAVAWNRQLASNEIGDGYGYRK